MSFTDDDLKRLKSDLEKHIVIDLIQDQGLSLLARMDAAEAVLLEIERFNNGILTDTSEFRAWRKAAGK